MSADAIARDAADFDAMASQWHFYKRASGGIGE